MHVSCFRFIMPAIKSQFWNYSGRAMKEAIQDVSANNAPVRTAAKKYSIRITLKYKVEGKSPIERKLRPQTIISYEEEIVIANWVLKMAEAGFYYYLITVITIVEGNEDIAIAGQSNIPSPF